MRASCDEQLGRAAQVVGGAPRVGRQRARGAVEQQLLRAHDRRRREPREVAPAVVAARLPGLVGGGDVERLGRRVEQDRADVDRRDAVDERVVHLRQQRDAPVAEALDRRSAPTAGASDPGAATAPGRRARRAPRRRPARAAPRGARASRGRSPSSSTHTGLARPAARRLQPLAVARDEVQPRGDPREDRVVAHPVAVLEQQQPPTAMLTGPCSAASDERSAGDSSSLMGQPTSRPMTGGCAPGR